MTKDEALKLALEAFAQYMPYQLNEKERIAQAAIKEALAQPEPVAWEQFYPEMGSPKLAYISPTESPENACYTTPPQRTWVGLTKAEVELLSYIAEGNTWIAVELAETKLKEKNT